jgi:hypothetical protein
VGAPARQSIRLAAGKSLHPGWTANGAPSDGELSEHVSLNVQNVTRNTSRYFLACAMVVVALGKAPFIATYAVTEEEERIL